MKKYSISLLNLYTKVFHLCFEHENNLDFFSLKVLLKNGPTPASFSFIFGLSNKHYKFLQQIYVKKCPSSIRCQDSNPRPSKRESSPITTRPGLPPKNVNSLSEYSLSCRSNGSVALILWPLLQSHTDATIFCEVFGSTVSVGRILSDQTV